MAHHKATIKAIKQTKVRTEANVADRSRLRSACKKVLVCVEAQNKEEASAALVVAQSELGRAVKKGLVKKGTASRKLSRLNSRVKTLVTAK